MLKRDRGALAVLALTMTVLVVLALIDGWPGIAASVSPWVSVDKKDSLAQWIVAAFSVLGTFVSVYAVFTVKDSLRLAREANNAATDANKMTNDLFVVDQRPWIKVGRPAFGMNHSRDILYINISTENIGKTPALSVELFAYAEGTALPGESASKLRDFVNNTTKPSDWIANHKVVFPQSAREVDTLAIYVDLLDKHNFIRVYYCILYKSNFSDHIYKTAGQCLFSLKSVGESDENGIAKVGAYNAFGASIAE
jgi:hypothetical protein